MGNAVGPLKQTTDKKIPSPKDDNLLSPTLSKEVSNLTVKSKSSAASSVPASRRISRQDVLEGAAKLKTSGFKESQIAQYSEEVSEEKKMRIFQEYPELKETLNHMKVSIDAAYKTLDNDSMNKTMSLSVRRTFEDTYSNYFEFPDHTHRRLIGDKLANEGSARLVTTYMNILSNDGEEYTMEGYKYECVEILRSFCWNYTDVSIKLCDEFGRAGFLTLMYNDLVKFKDTYKSSEKQSFIVLSAMSVIYNCAKSSSNMKYFRSMNGIVDTLLWYSKNSKDHPHTSLIAPLSTITLAYVVDDEQNDLISADDSVIDTIINLVRGALNTSTHMMDGFTATELVEGLKKLASHPRNSEVIMKKGVIISLKKMLKTGTEEEKVAAAKAIWVLAFNDQNKQEITNVHQEVITLLTEMRSQNEHKSLRNVSAGALWVLEGKSSHKANMMRKKKDFGNVKKKRKKKKPGQLPDGITQHMSMPLPQHDSDDDDDDDKKSLSSSEEEEGVAADEVTAETKHIMISYQWHYQKLMIKVKSSLEENGYRVWMDVVEMGGSTLQKMADAVEKADVVLVGLSQRYKDSVSCRTEAEYAYKCNKDVIPLLLEKDYKPDGWLGAILGAKFYFDFTNFLMYEPTFRSLQKELGNRGKIAEFELKMNKITNDLDDLQMLPPIIKIKNFSEWDSEEVREWISTQNYKQIKLRELDGAGLVFLKKLRTEAPEFFYRFLTEQLQLRHLKDLKKFTEALEELI